MARSDPYNPFTPIHVAPSRIRDVDRIVGGIIDAYTLAPNDEDEKREAVARQVRAAIATMGQPPSSRAFETLRHIESALDELADDPCCGWGPLLTEVRETIAAMGQPDRDAYTIDDLDAHHRDGFYNGWAVARANPAMGQPDPLSEPLKSCACTGWKPFGVCRSPIGPGPGTYCAAKAPTPPASDLERARRIVALTLEEGRDIGRAAAREEFATVRAEQHDATWADAERLLRTMGFEDSANDLANNRPAEPSTEG